MTAIGARAPLYLIDSSIYIFRSYFACQPLWQSRSGMPTEAVYGFARFMLRLLTRERPTHIVAAFDESLGTGIRHQWYPDYKANRALPDEALALQLAACRAVAEALGVATCASEAYEADDLIATYARRGRKRGHNAVVVSSDKDLAQLLGRGDCLWDYGRKTSVTREEFIQGWGFAPERVPDFLALVGDPSDNIPGVSGVGVKTARALLQEFTTLDEMLAAPERVAAMAIRGAARIARQLSRSAQQLQLSRRLATLLADAPETLDMADLCWKGFELAPALALCEEYGLDSLRAAVIKLHREAVDNHA